MTRNAPKLKNPSIRRLMFTHGHGRRRWLAGLGRTSTRRGENGSAPAKQTPAIMENPSARHVGHSGVSRSLDYLTKHWSESIRVMDLARVARMSRRGFLKAFSKHAGDTPGRRLRLIRLEKAREMLLQSNSKLVVVAHACGFQSMNSFIVAFKRHVGVAPIRYRTQAIRKAFATRPRSRPTHNFQSFLQKL
jgi:AraC-like DNA-binding protein